MMQKVLHHILKLTLKKQIEISKLHHHLKCFNKSELDSNSNGFTNIKVILNKFNKSELVSNELENTEDILIKSTK